MRIFITYCSRSKNDFFKHNNLKVSPDQLYVSPRIKNFMNKCKLEKVQWAIFSDLYSVWFPNEYHLWYEKSPSEISEPQLNSLIQMFDEKLKVFDEIWFYYNPSRFHSIYKKLIEKSKLHENIALFSHLSEIRSR